MHKRNIHRYGYDFIKLAKTHPALESHLITLESAVTSIDFGNVESVVAFNTALLKHHYSIKYWKLPENSLVPPIPGRADYVHHIADLVGKEAKKGLDIGCGASAIYTILGNAIYDYTMVGSDIHEESVRFATANTDRNDAITIRHQSDRANIFNGIILPGEYYDFTMCNPPFYASQEEADKANLKKQRNLGLPENGRNFSGSAHELYCNGGEALFIKRMIKESAQFKTQVGWFTCLVSKSENLKTLEKQLKKAKTIHYVVPMESGNKKSRFIAWKFKEVKTT